MDLAELLEDGRQTREESNLQELRLRLYQLDTHLDSVAASINVSNSILSPDITPRSLSENSPYGSSKNSSRTKYTYSPREQSYTVLSKELDVSSGRLSDGKPKQSSSRLYSPVKHSPSYHGVTLPALDSQRNSSSDASELRITDRFQDGDIARVIKRKSAARSVLERSLSRSRVVSPSAMVEDKYTSDGEEPKGVRYDSFHREDMKRSVTFKDDYKDVLSPEFSTDYRPSKRAQHLSSTPIRLYDSEGSQLARPSKELVAVSSSFLPEPTQHRRNQIFPSRWSDDEIEDHPGLSMEDLKGFGSPPLSGAVRQSKTSPLGPTTHRHEAHTAYWDKASRVDRVNLKKWYEKDSLVSEITNTPSHDVTPSSDESFKRCSPVKDSQTSYTHMVPGRGYTYRSEHVRDQSSDDVNTASNSYASDDLAISGSVINDDGVDTDGVNNDDDADGIDDTDESDRNEKYDTIRRSRPTSSSRQFSHVPSDDSEMEADDYLPRKKTPTRVSRQRNLFSDTSPIGPKHTLGYSTGHYSDYRLLLSNSDEDVEPMVRTSNYSTRSSSKGAVRGLFTESSGQFSGKDTRKVLDSGHLLVSAQYFNMAVCRRYFTLWKVRTKLRQDLQKAQSFWKQKVLQRCFEKIKTHWQDSHLFTVCLLERGQLTCKSKCFDKWVERLHKRMVAETAMQIPAHEHENDQNSLKWLSPKGSTDLMEDAFKYWRTQVFSRRLHSKQNRSTLQRAWKLWRLKRELRQINRTLTSVTHNSLLPNTFHLSSSFFPTYSYPETGVHSTDSGTELNLTPARWLADETLPPEKGPHPELAFSIQRVSESLSTSSAVQDEGDVRKPFRNNLSTSLPVTVYEPERKVPHELKNLRNTSFREGRLHEARLWGLRNRGTTMSSEIARSSLSAAFHVWYTRTKANCYWRRSLCLKVLREWKLYVERERRLRTRSETVAHRRNILLLKYAFSLWTAHHRLVCFERLVTAIRSTNRLKHAWAIWTNTASRLRTLTQPLSCSLAAIPPSVRHDETGTALPSPSHGSHVSHRVEHVTAPSTTVIPQILPATAEGKALDSEDDGGGNTADEEEEVDVASSSGFLSRGCDTEGMFTPRWADGMLTTDADDTPRSLPSIALDSTARGQVRSKDQQGRSFHTESLLSQPESLLSQPQDVSTQTDRGQRSFNQEVDSSAHGDILSYGIAALEAEGVTTESNLSGCVENPTTSVGNIINHRSKTEQKFPEEPEISSRTNLSSPLSDYYGSTCFRSLRTPSTGSDLSFDQPVTLEEENLELLRSYFDRWTNSLRTCQDFEAFADDIYSENLTRKCMSRWAVRWKASKKRAAAAERLLQRPLLRKAFFVWRSRWVGSTGHHSSHESCRLISNKFY